MANYIDDLAAVRFCVRGVVTENHSSNVNAFSKLVTTFDSNSALYIQHPLTSSKKKKKTYLFFDTVLIMKNIRNNLLNGKKFLFLEFIYNDGLHININCPAEAKFDGKICTTFMTYIKG